MKESRTFGHVVELLFFLLRLLLSPFRPISRLEAENAALRRQLMVLQRQVRGRVQFTNSDRLFFLQLYRWFASIVKAMTTIPARDAGAMASRGFLSLLALEIPEPGRSAKMTNDEFDQAIEAIRQGQITPRERRVIAAAVFMIRELCSVPANWEPTNIQIVEFIDGLDKPSRRILKRVADDAKAESTLSTSRGARLATDESINGCGRWSAVDHSRASPSDDAPATIRV